MKGLMRGIVLASLCSLTLVALAVDKSITESYTKVQAAVLKKDGAAMKQVWLAYVDPSCVIQRKGRKVSYKQMTDQIEAQMKAIKKVNSCKIQILYSKSSGGKVVCTTETIQSFVIPIDGKDSTFDQISTVDDTWKKINGKYKIVEIKTIKETLKRDGVVIPNN